MVNPVWVEICVNIIIGYLILDRIKKIEADHLSHVEAHARGEYASKMG